MSFKAIHSNRVENLRDALLAELAGNPLVNPLAQEFVLVDNHVLGEWLNIQLAQQHGIAANIRYIQPHELFWLLARTIVSSAIPRETPLSKEEMTWKLYGLLGDSELLAAAVMQPVKNYLADKNSRDLKRYQLAASVADLFDQYLIYRPDWINSWSAGKAAAIEKNKTDSESWQASEAWQRLLWKKLQDSSSIEVPELCHRAAIEAQLLNKLDNLSAGATGIKWPMQRLFVFGITSMPPKLVDMLMLLGKQLPVTVFVLNPCQHDWFSIRSEKQLVKQLARKIKQIKTFDEQYYETGNPLLASQGTQVQEFVGSLYGKMDQYEIEDVDAFADPGNQTLLSRIQQEMLDLEYPDTTFLPNENIPSVHVHQCHSIMREVEVLHDQLHDMLAKNPDIQPRDIVVMMPQVAPYVPAIHAVFSGVNSSGIKSNGVATSHRLAYHITDRAVVDESPLLNSITTLLALPDSRLPLSEVIALLEIPAVQRRFNLDTDGYETVKRWLVASGARWGIDGAHRGELGLPTYHAFSWEFGLDRLFSGYAMQVDDEASIDSIVHFNEKTAGNKLPVQPYDHIEGASAACFDGFLRFWHKLNEWRALLKQEATPEQWAERLRSLMDDFYQPDEEDETLALKAVYSGIRVLDQSAGQQWYQGLLPLSVIQDLIKPVIQQPARGRHHWREGVKFCSLLPMRGVPFKVVYILGMNLEDYPRRLDKKSFDLMRKHHRVGDRASRTDDRWLFLEALLSARRYFHVSYIGRDMHRNEPCEPSVVLSELIAYVREHLQDKQSLVTEHPLQPFSENYFLDKGSLDKGGLDKKDHVNNSEEYSARLFSFNQQALLIARGKQSGFIREPGETRWQSHTAIDQTINKTTEINIHLDDFVRFFTKPWDWFFKSKHHVRLAIEEDVVEDEEMYETRGGLESWQQRQDLIHRVNAFVGDVSDQEAVLQQLMEELVCLRKATGQWPVGLAGERAIMNIKNKIKIDYFFASRGKIKIAHPVSLALNTPLGVLTITGDITVHHTNEYDKTLLIHSASSNKADKQLDFYLRLLLALCSDAGKMVQGGQTIFAKSSKGFSDVQTIDASAIKPVEARQWLTELAGLYLQYRETGLPFHPALGYELYELVKEDGDSEEIENAIDRKWYGNKASGDFQNRGMAEEIAQRSYFGSVDALKCQSFQQTAQQVWQGPGEWLVKVEES